MPNVAEAGAFRFPKDFLWGAGISAYQAEGAFDAGGKGASNQDALNGKNGFHDTRITSDFYHRYPEDIQLMKELGLRSFRFSIAWTRIYPNGKTLNPEGLAFYKKLAAALCENGIEPLATLYHFDHPQCLQESLGGWTNSEMISYFLRFAETCFKELRQIKYWLTICEQNNIVLYPDLIGGVTPGMDAEIWRFTAAHVMSRASTRAISLCHQIRPDAKIGPCIGYPVSYPLDSDPENVWAAMTEDEFRVFYQLDLLCHGRRNKRIERYLRSRGEVEILSDRELAEMGEARPDFIAFNYYHSNTAVSCPEGDETQPAFNLAGEKGGVVYPSFPGLYRGCANPRLSRSDWDWEIDPMGFRIAFQKLYDRYRLPLMVTENGLGAYDKLEDKAVHDQYRIKYLKLHMEQMQAAMNDGIEIWGYYPWSFMDLMSTSNGYNKRYGFVYINRGDQLLNAKSAGPDGLERYKKDSFYWYRQWITEYTEEHGG
jgi:6-phospho-beta-glucosidase